MNGDWLEDAARAARDVGKAPAGDAARTRADVLRRLGARGARSRRPKRVAAWVGLLAAALLVGTAWAAPSSRARLVAWLRSSEEPRAVAADGPEHGAAAGGAVSVRPMGSMGSMGALPDEPAVEPTPALLPSASASPLEAPTFASAPVAAAAREPATPKPVTADRDALFSEAQALHFKAKDPARALAAWDRYLASQADAGWTTLVPEARYNRAICLVRLHRTGEARAALRPFAGGTWGGYRQQEARALLDSLGDPGPPAP